ncbi:hypothetical protein CC78DRAFT_600478 [Lojkania enalia]|uniref:Uncharacterized protein n=1 Tax=Lojkania enalia TaxID=147567 RepID=A0A9P4JZY3_9PLEO|nr:hypothetical protein CC78DRAFT_600478 [Didymosphaeria enalia]
MSSSSQLAAPIGPAKLHDYLGFSRPPHATKLTVVNPLNIKFDDGPDGATLRFLHMPPSLTPSVTTATVVLSGAGSGVMRLPSNI